MPEYAFDSPEPVALYVENGSGSIRISATDTRRSEVRIVGKHADDVVVTYDAGRLSVVPPKLRGGLFGGDQKLDMAIEVPTSSEVVVRSGSADVDVQGLVGTAEIKSGSGDVRLDRVGGHAVVDTGSGDVNVEEAAEEMRVRSGSGDVRVHAARGEASISTGSGDVRIDHSHAAVVVKTGSGDLDLVEAESDVSMATGSGDTVIRTARRGRISSKAASGDVHVGIPDGTPVWTDITTVTGSVRTGLHGVGEPEPGADHVEVRASTVSGDVVLAPA